MYNYIMYCDVYFRLREWYTTVGHSENAKSLSRAGGSGDLNVPLYTLQEATEARLGEKMNISDAFMMMATNKMIRVENAIYEACPIESCKKKLIDQSTGVFRCEKCNKEYPNFSYRLLASVCILFLRCSLFIICKYILIYLFDLLS
ncbi:PREDICTED: replication protein A 70 kDa DNA-binding subunit-like [Vollenhovia emeryi]|uniref:replication protein A 70 kDa DNA-binding subunit-like n=1 Tax=Vollenhovia emeryi TaxID=411798 RepID=UPI0005F4C085|nr:PREDICTED: replication protein A 70 kDa DNA-binding subunit-like [Vollenhovia emeryi]